MYFDICCYMWINVPFLKGLMVVFKQKEFKIVTDLNKCKCITVPIVRYINFKVMDGHKNVFLDDHKEILKNQEAIDKLNSCLAKHGFKGIVKQVDAYIMYGEYNGK